MPRLELLGVPRWLDVGKAASLGATLATCLVVRLAIARGWVQREALLPLLWPESEETAARASLRQLLRALPTELSEYVERHGQALRYAATSDIADAHLLALAGDWPSVLALHRGPLLDGFLPRRAPAFEEWLAEERAAFTNAFHDAARRAFDAAIGAEAAVAAVDIADRWLRRDPTDRDVALAIAGGLLRLDRAADALRVLRRHAGAVAGLGLEVDDDVAARIEALRNAPQRPLGPRARDRPETTRPRRHAPLVGRDGDLDALDAWWAGAGRWLTIVAPGGMGKSTLVEAWSASLSPDATEVDVVDLDGVTDPADAARRVLQAIARGAPQGASGPAPFARLVGDLPHLLVLDGAESLEDAAATLSAWCDSAPGLRLLVTSRRALGGIGERVRPLAALSVAPLPDGAASHAAKAAWRAARAAAGVVGEPDEPPRVVQRHVARLGGWPLGLKLLGGWAAWLGLDGWLAALGSNELDVSSDAGVRVVEGSWTHLGEPARIAMARLAALPRPWTLDDARGIGVAAVTLHELAATGWVSGGAGAFTIHPLLADHARRHHADATAAARQRHAHHVLGTFEESYERSGRPPPHAHRRAAHLIDAWSWACEAADVVRLERALPVVENALMDARLVVDAQACIEQAVGVAGEGSRLRRHLDVALLRALAESPDRAVGHALADRIDAEAATAGDGFARARVAAYRATVAYVDRRDLAAAAAIAADGLAQVDGAVDRRSRAVAAQLANLIGVVEGGRGNPQAAEAWLHRATEFGHAAGGPSEAAGWSHNLILAYLERGRFPAALALADHNVAVGERDGSRIARVERWHLRGVVLATLGDLAGARRSFERAIAVAEPMHAHARGRWQRNARLGLASVAAREGSFQEARGLADAQDPDAFVASVQARIALASGDLAAAARHVDLGIGHLDREGGPESDLRLHALLSTLRADVVLGTDLARRAGDALGEATEAAGTAVFDALDAALRTGLDPTIAEAAAVALRWLRASHLHELAASLAITLAGAATAPDEARAAARRDLEAHHAHVSNAAWPARSMASPNATAGEATLARLVEEVLTIGRSRARSVSPPATTQPRGATSG